MRTFVLATTLCLAGAAQAQTCFYAPDNIPTGICNVIPFGVNSPTDPTWSNQKYQTIITAASLGNTRGIICELAFAPCGTGLREFSTIKIQMDTTTATTLTTTFAANLNRPFTVLDTTNYKWTNVANAWNRIGLQVPFPYNGNDNLVIDIEVTGVGMPVGTAGMGRAATHQRVYAFGWTGSAPLIGSTDTAAAKVEVCFDADDLWTFGQGCPGSNSQTPALSQTGSSKIGNVFTVDLAGGVPNTPTLFFAGFRNDKFRGALPLPMDLGPIGAPGCWIYVDAPVILAAPIDANGNASLRFAVPRDTALLCGRLYSQYLPIDPRANTLGVTTSNYGRALIGS